MYIKIMLHDLSLKDLPNFFENILIIFDNQKLAKIALENSSNNSDHTTLIVPCPEDLKIDSNKLINDLSIAIDGREIELYLSSSVAEEKLTYISSKEELYALSSSHSYSLLKNKQSPKSNFFQRYLKHVYEAAPINFSTVTGYRYMGVPHLKGNLLVGKLFDVTKPNGMFDTILSAGELALNSEKKASYFWLGPQPVVFIIEPKDIVQTFYWNSENIKRLTFAGFDKVFDAHSFFILKKDNFWRDSRNAIKNQVFTHEALVKNSATMKQTAEDFLQEIKSRQDNMIDLGDLFHRFSINLVAKNSFQLNNLPTNTAEFAEQANRVTEYMFGMQHQIALAFPEWLRLKIFPNEPGDEGIKAIKQKIYDTNEKLIFTEENKAILNDPNGLLNKVSHLHKKYVENSNTENADGPNMPGIESTNSFISLFFGALYSTASTLLFAFKLINKHPQVEAKLLEELQGVDNIDFSTIEKMKYLDCVLKEVMRLYPPNFLLVRQVERDFNLIHSTNLENIHSKNNYNEYCASSQWSANDAIHLYSNDLIMYSPYLTHRLPHIWPNPEEFKPERFSFIQPSPGSYIPFGIGQQDCVGRMLALNGMKLILALIYKNYSVQIENNDDFSLEANAIAIRLKHPVKASFISRQTNTFSCRP